MNDPADKDSHYAEGAAPYPKPAKTEATGKPGDGEDPGKLEGDTRATAKDGSYTTGTDAMREQLYDERGREAWKYVRTQERSRENWPWKLSPPGPHA